MFVRRISRQAIEAALVDSPRLLLLDLSNPRAVDVARALLCAGADVFACAPALLLGGRPVMRAPRWVTNAGVVYAR